MSSNQKNWWEVGRPSVSHTGGLGGGSSNNCPASAIDLTFDNEDGATKTGPQSAAEAAAATRATSVARWTASSSTSSHSSQVRLQFFVNFFECFRIFCRLKLTAQRYLRTLHGQFRQQADYIDSGYLICLLCFGRNRGETVARCALRMVVLCCFRGSLASGWPVLCLICIVHTIVLILPKSLDCVVIE